MSLANLLKGVDIYTLPDSLKQFVQEQTASGLGKIRFIPLAFPVFVMNPAAYPTYVNRDTLAGKQFKELLLDRKQVPAVNDLLSTVVSSGEIWRVSNIHGETAIAGGDDLELLVREGGTGIVYDLKYVDGANKIYWTGSLWLEAADGIYFNTNLNSVLTLNVVGEKYYA